MEEKGQHQSLETTLFRLLEQKGPSTDPLILLSLVNLMGLINLMGYRLGISGKDAAVRAGGKGEGSSPRPANREIPPQLAGLFGSLLGPAGPPRAPSASPAEGNTAVKEEEKPARD
ncbi:MAG: hypothetical protein PWP72_2198 [Thermoanaerobacter sp.]|jgi:hypothetical protein|uniref:hypothetical protein n=1 Tax=Desulfofundulus thermocisternus TaxID=42471 RepID=UPI00048569DF|nr:hypothetical protein [Desulfofundulus thermocisternus]MDK2889320.1 hypothetical protein [Thermoanaerobacter sp.]